MDVTTVKISKTTKATLDNFRHKDESYDKTIARLLKENNKKDLKKRLIEGYKARAKEDLKIAHEWRFVTGEIKE